ncbi:hypothetical protein SSP24_73260 [Streptomyces spinoverrucosus]|uniref:Integral membrane protein n=1 Tax=Streptomyces spinoverrucosus TaxID=284043 RepID=A0A4Y3VVA7_9ACTN|nr:hypothetical protein [Streptomyces spinoverrucosus]GEC09671.1 hypothetical protein SSP24_73260 [Streptomyces spinoverrucosus]GHB67565.1 hypothetical protein GCM10010397_42120 [Streptomyces spinoverrucosus]
MTDVHQRDLPGAPSSPGAWDGVTTEPPADSAPQRTPRRGPADPVKALMHRHRDLCERAVDPLEIAAGLEAHGITDRTAARFRHKDVFSLAEEMYARIPHDNDTPHTPTPPTTSRPHTTWLLRTLLPGTTCAATVAALHLTHGRPRLLAATAGTLAVTLSLRAALTRGPLSAQRSGPPGTLIWTCWLLAYAALGDGLLMAAASGGPEALPTTAPNAPWPLTTAPLLTLTISCAPAAWLAHHFATRARNKLTTSRALEDFATSVRPLLLGTVGLFLATVAALLPLTAVLVDEPAPYPQTLTLTAHLFLARLLAIHGFTHAPAVILTATATAQATALVTLFAARLPHCAFLATPVETLIDTWGPGTIPTLTCGTAALALLIHATRKLPRASAHARTATRW